LYLGQPFGRRGQNAVEVPEPIQQGACQRFHIPPRDRAEQHELQQLVIGHGFWTASQEAVAQTLAVVADIGRLRARRRSDLHLILGEQRQGGFGKRTGWHV